MILLTGGTGFIGSYLLYYLLGENDTVRATYRAGSSFAQTQFIFRHLAAIEPDVNPNESWENTFRRIQWVEADMQDITALQEAMEEVDMIFHAAAKVSFDVRDSRVMIRNNVEGTANVVNVALEKGIKKLAYVSSVAALAKREGSITTEQDKVEERDFTNAYSESKYRAEMEVWRGHTEGLKAVTINPSVVLGWGDFSKGSTAIFRTIGEGLRFYPPGTGSYVDARDVARALIALSKREEAYGQRFIAAAESISYRDFFSRIASALGVTAPKYAAGALLQNMVWLGAEVKALLTNSKPFITRDLVRTSAQHYTYSSDKLRQMLGFQFLPLDKTIADTARVYKEWERSGIQPIHRPG